MDERQFEAASHIELAERETAIAASRAARLKATGACHNCDEPLTDFLLFCNLECRDDYQKRNPQA